MHESNSELCPYGDAEIAQYLASPEVVKEAINVDEFKDYLRQEDGLLSSELPAREKPRAANILFKKYLTYLRDKRYRYTLGPGPYFWDPGGRDYQNPTGSCLTVTKSFLFLLWAYGFDKDCLKVHALDCPDSERIVFKKPLEVAGINRPDAGLNHFFDNLDKRGFKPSRATGRLEALRPPRNPYQAHAIGYVEHGGAGNKYYDSVTGYNYPNPRNYFRLYTKGPNFTYDQNRARRTLEVYYDQSHAKRRIYRLPDALVGNAEGGIWIIVDDEDWAIGEYPVHPPAVRANPPGLLEYCLHMPSNAFLHNIRR
jgi:hypothetical protein